METTAGTLLGGRLRYAQPAEGYRTGIEPVLLAAAIPARPGERVLEGGTGAGAGLMCLAARVPGVLGLAVEIDGAMAELARQNIAANGLSGLEVRALDLMETELAGFDHAFANPPWHDARSTPSPVVRRRLAKQAAEGTLEEWIGALLRALRPEGTITLVLPAALADRVTAALREPDIVPLLPKAGRAPKLVLVHAAKPGAGKRISAGREPIILHEGDGRYTPEIEAVLRDGAALSLGRSLRA